eukprot:jgi/Tetstr1/447940/TSEL_035246.t1
MITDMFEASIAAANFDKASYYVEQEFYRLMAMAKGPAHLPANAAERISLLKKRIDRQCRGHRRHGALRLGGHLCCRGHRLLRVAMRHPRVPPTAEPAAPTATMQKRATDKSFVSHIR